MKLNQWRLPGVWLYFSRRAMLEGVSALNAQLTWHGRLRRRLKDWALRTWCRLRTGHNIVVQRWGTIKKDDGEWHMGCQHCPLFWVEAD